MTPLTYIGLAGSGGGVFCCRNDATKVLAWLPAAPRVLTPIQERQRFAHGILSDALGYAPDGELRALFAYELLEHVEPVGLFAIGGDLVDDWLFRRGARPE